MSASSAGAFETVVPTSRRGRAARVRVEARLPAFEGLSVDAPAALAGLRLAVVGAGSIGRNIVEKAARLHVGAVQVVDPGRFKPESLLTHCSLEPAEVDRRAPKARSAAEMAARISPATEVSYHAGPFEDLGPAALIDADAVLMATDNLAAEIAVAQHCLHLSKPLFHAAVYGEALLCQLRCYAHRPGRGPCLRCGLTPDEEDLLNRHVAFRCTGVAGERAVENRAVAATMSTAFLCSLAGDLAMNQVLRTALRLGSPVTDCQIEFCGYTWRTTVSPLPGRSPACRCDHTPWRVERLPGPVERRTLRELATRADLPGGSGGGSVQVDALLFVGLGVCPRCGLRPVRRFVAVGRPAGACDRCGAPLKAHPFFSSRPTPLAELGDVLDVPLGPLGADNAAGVVIRGADEGVLFRRQANGA